MGNIFSLQLIYTCMTQEATTSSSSRVQLQPKKGQQRAWNIAHVMDDFNKIIIHISLKHM